MHYKPAQQDGGFDVRTRKATEYGLSEYMSTKDTQFENTIKAILVAAANTKINWYGIFHSRKTCECSPCNSIDLYSVNV